MSWENFKNALVARFGAGRPDNLYEELKEMWQKGIVDDYIWDFELYSSQCGKLPELQFLGYFIAGLKSEIRNRVRTLKLKNRYQAMQMARDIEAELLSWKEDEDGGSIKQGAIGPSTQ